MTTDTSTLVLDDLAQRTLFTEARSPMHFDDRPVPLDVVQSAYDLVKWGPTGSNSMPLRLAIADSPGARAANSHDNTWLQLGYLIVGLRAAGLAVRAMGGFGPRGADPRPAGRDRVARRGTPRRRIPRAARQ